MESNKFQNYEKKKYKSLFLLMLGWMFMQPGTMSYHFGIESKMLHIVFALISLVGVAMMLLGGWMLFKISMEAKKDPHVASVINDELSVANANKAFRMGFLFFCLSCIALMLALLFVCPISALFAVKLVLFFGISGYFVTWLLLSKPEKYARE